MKPYALQAEIARAHHQMTGLGFPNAKEYHDSFMTFAKTHLRQNISEIGSPFVMTGK
jgi:hypothetical protein